jgi:serine/threonine-protein kinase RsbW
LELPSSLDAVEATTTVAKVSAQMCGFDERTDEGIELAFREAVINAIRHGNKEDSSKLVRVQLVCGDDDFSITIEDQGAGFDPTAVANPTDAEHLLKPSGRGILFMQSLMDDVQVTHSPSGGTLVRMTKRRESKSSSFK